MKLVFTIIFLATLFRFYLLLEFTPHCCGSDEKIYHSLAKNLVETGQFVVGKNDDSRFWTDKVYGYKPPLYPLFLAGIYKTFSINPDFAKIIQILLSGLTGYFIFQIGKITFNEKVGITSLIIFSFFWETAFMSLNLMSENLYWLFLSVFIFLLIKKDSVGLLRYILIGTVLGLCTLTRAASLSLIVPILIWFLWKRINTKSIAQALTIVLFFILTLSPWIIRNYKIYNQFVPIYTDGGISFWAGNYHGSGGSYNVPKASDPNQTPILKSEGINQEIEYDSFYYNQAKTYVLNNPIEALDVNIRKIFNTFSTYRAYVLNTTSERGEWPIARPKSLGIDAFMEFLVSYQFAFLSVFFVLSLTMLLKNINATLNNRRCTLLIILFFWSLLLIAISHYEPRYITHLYILMIPIASVLITPFYLKVIKEFKYK